MLTGALGVEAGAWAVESLGEVDGVLGAAGVSVAVADGVGVLPAGFAGLGDGSA